MRHYNAIRDILLLVCIDMALKYLRIFFEHCRSQLFIAKSAVHHSRCTAGIGEFAGGLSSCQGRVAAPRVWEIADPPGAGRLGSAQRLREGARRFYPRCRSRSTDEQILMALRQAEGGPTVADICRKLEITEAMFYRLKKQVAGLEGSELWELRELREENRKLRQLVADLSLDERIPKDSMLREW